MWKHKYAINTEGMQVFKMVGLNVHSLRMAEDWTYTVLVDLVVFEIMNKLTLEDDFVFLFS